MSMDSRPILNHSQLEGKAQEVAQQFLSGEPFPFRYMPTGHEEVTAAIAPMPSIPAGDNPMHHDDFSMGTFLVRGWQIMHPGFDGTESVRKDARDQPEPRAMEWFYLVNLRTGQRIQIHLHHEPTAEMLQAQRDKWEQDRADDCGDNV